MSRTRTFLWVALCAVLTSFFYDKTAAQVVDAVVWVGTGLWSHWLFGKVSA